jgi:hypothetical protein
LVLPLKKSPKEKRFEMKKFICAEHSRQYLKLYKNQRQFEKDIMILETLEDLKKKGGKNYKNKLSILKSLVEDIKPYITFNNIKKEMKEKTKEIMLLNLVYIGLQLENIQETHYIYFKIGEKIFKYFDLYQNFYKKLIEDNKDLIKNIKKITKRE